MTRISRALLSVSDKAGLAGFAGVVGGTALGAAIGGARLAAIICTHTHRDHSPAAAPLAAATGAPVIGCAFLSLDDDGPRSDAAFDTTYAPDRVLAIGRDPDEPAFFWVAGQGGYGFQTAPAASALVADLVAGRPPALDAPTVAALDPARFG